LYNGEGLAVTQGTRVRVDTEAGTTRLEGQGDIEFWHVYVEATDEHSEAEGYMSSRHMEFVVKISYADNVIDDDTNDETDTVDLASENTEEFNYTTEYYVTGASVNLRGDDGDHEDMTQPSIRETTMVMVDDSVEPRHLPNRGPDLFLPVQIGDREGFMAVAYLSTDVPRGQSVDLASYSPASALDNWPSLPDPNDIDRVAEYEEIMRLRDVYLEMIENHNDVELPGVRGELESHNIYNPWPIDGEPPLRSVDPRSNLSNIDTDRWYNVNGHYRWAVSGTNRFRGTEVLLLEQKHLNYAFRLGYNPNNDGSVFDFIESRRVSVDFFGRSYELDPITAAALQYVEAVLQYEGVEYTDHAEAHSRHGISQPRGDASEWREIDGTGRPSNHLFSAVDIQAEWNCWYGGHCSDQIVNPSYMNTEFVQRHDNPDTPGSDDFETTHYSAPSRDVFLRAFWEAGFRTPFEWARIPLGLNAETGEYTSRWGEETVNGPSRNFDEFFEYYFPDGENTNLVGDLQHFDFLYDDQGRIRTRHLDEDGNTMSFTGTGRAPHTEVTR